MRNKMPKTGRLSRRPPLQGKKLLKSRESESRKPTRLLRKRQRNKLWNLGQSTFKLNRTERCKKKSKTR